MDAQHDVWPVVAMVVPTFSVWVRLFAIRIAEMKHERIHPQAVALSAQALQTFRDTRAADNLRNLFDLPVLFYVGMLFGAWLAIRTPALRVLAWLFVLLRIAYSAIQCTYNKVMYRLRAYFAGALTLWAFWAVIDGDCSRNER